MLKTTYVLSLGKTRLANLNKDKAVIKSLRCSIVLIYVQNWQTDGAVIWL